MTKLPIEPGQAFEQLPKVELHYHLDGGLRPSTVRALATEADIPLPKDEEQFLQLIQVQDSCNSLTSYLEKFQLPISLMQTAANLERIAFEAVEDAANTNVKYIEIRFAPQLHVEQGLTLEAIVTAVLKGMQRGEAQCGTISRLILICLRNHPVSMNEQVLELAKMFYRKGVVGIDLAGDEAGYPAILHKSVFEAAHLAGIPITIHAGEAAGADSIRDAIFALHAQRIGHGVRLEQNQDLLSHVRESQTTLEMCFSSNIQTKAAADRSLHPIRRYYDEGIAVTVNTDNATVSNTTLNLEYGRLANNFGFEPRDFMKMNTLAIKASFVEDEIKAALLRNHFAE
ncbi:adenosine deaminase [Paenibacillus selenitireducens]|uniref:adenosine deaminase n=1 Tax=Paenibacillus selenitireducens TaxID=1324314 RepID=A0A1T2XKK4_9BACL|nr:adenosine deaminase [Paenibacillus selenitireducens]OPA80401.1 adenosine deaminase [Paenibacillus selenitireducens]